MKALLVFSAVLTCSFCFASEEEFARKREVVVTPGAIVISAEYPKPYGKTTVSMTQTNGRLSSLVFRSEAGVATVPPDLLADITDPRLADAQFTWSIGRRAQEIHASVAIPFGVLQGDPPRYSKRSFTIVDGELRYTILYTPSKDWYETKYKEIKGIRP